MRVVLLHPFSVPRFDLVPVRVTVRPGDVVWARSAAAPPVSPEPHAAAAALLPRCSRSAAADEGRGHGHRLLMAAAGVAVELQRLSDLGDQRVHFFGVNGDGLLQEDVVLLPTGHGGGSGARAGFGWVLDE